jgi:hypothetical protein
MIILQDILRMQLILSIYLEGSDLAKLNAFFPFAFPRVSPTIPSSCEDRKSTTVTSIYCNYNSAWKLVKLPIASLVAPATSKEGHIRI